MDTKTQTSYLEHAEHVYQKSEKSKLSTAFFKEVESDLSILADYLKLTPQQTVFLVILLNKSFDNYRVTFDCVSKHLGKSPIGLLQFREDFNYLVENNYLEMDGETKFVQFDNMHGILVNKNLKTALVDGKPLPQLKAWHFDNALAFIHEVHQSVNTTNLEKKNKLELHRDLTKLFHNNKHLSLLQALEALEINVLEISILLYAVWEMVFKEEHCYLTDLAEAFYETQIEQFTMIHAFKKQEHKLMSSGLVSLQTDDQIRYNKMLFTEKCQQLFLNHELELKNKEKENKLFFTASKFEAKTLVFDETIQNSLGVIQNALQEERFSDIQAKLLELHGSKGIMAMFYGAPGTGKTEFVKQLALRTKRELMWVNISETKSYWYGESQKLIKQVFDDYRKKVDRSSRTPILLFNEADAIFSKRLSDSQTPVDETHNAIQNILLEELERFDGILIATTNMMENFDSAFERRFLFKVNFPKPNDSLRQLIWKSKIPNLKNSDYQKLAAQFDFSGGQIDNIIRKKVIYEITQGKQVNFNQLLAFCEDETINQNVKKIGF
jgi:AAA+ superfamily predicted ATPase